MQRLAQHSWIHIHQGKSTIVQDYWKEGNLNMLNTPSKQPETLTLSFITSPLKVRAASAPVYTRLAFCRKPEQLIGYLEEFIQLPDDPDAYAQAHQEPHHQLPDQIGSQQINIIRVLKKHFDPYNIMNPGGTLRLDMSPAQKGKRWGKDYEV